MNYSIREARIEDLDRLVSFVEAEAIEAEGATIPPEKLRAGILFGLQHKDIARYWVLETPDGEVIGHISVVKEWSDWHAGFYWWIQSIFMAPEYRGMQLMGLLIRRIKEEGKKEGALEIRLYVHKNNQRAIGAYLREGFAESDYLIMKQKIN